MPFEILVRISLVIATSIYSRELSKVHSTRHIPNLQKYLSDETLVIPLDEIEFHKSLTFVKEP